MGDWTVCRNGCFFSGVDLGDLIVGSARSNPASFTVRGTRRSSLRRMTGGRDSVLVNTGSPPNRLMPRSASSGARLGRNPLRNGPHLIVSCRPVRWRPVKGIGVRRFRYRCSMMSRDVVIIDIICHPRVIFGRLGDLPHLARPGNRSLMCAYRRRNTPRRSHREMRAFVENRA